MSLTTHDYLIRTSRDKGAGFLMLLDPDRIDPDRLPTVVVDSAEAGVDAFLIGTSMLLTESGSHVIRAIKRMTELPAILFPGNSLQVVPDADAILFLSLISGRNSNYLIAEQVKGAPLIRNFGIEAIPTGYMLVESGKHTSVEYISDTKPIPRDKPDIAKVHALAAEYLGMQLIYLEAGSGATMTVPDSMIEDVTHYISRPVIVGGGIRSPEEARNKAAAGASFVVIGSRFERETSLSLVTEFADAIHVGARTEATL